MLTGWLDIDRSFAMMDEYRARMDQILREMETGHREATWTTVTWPRINFHDTGDAFVLRAEVPGVAREDLKISACAESLTLSGERKTSVPEGYSVHRQERAPVRFSRSFTFPTRIDVDNTRATLRNGILELVFPKAPEVKPRAIDVHTA